MSGRTQSNTSKKKKTETENEENSRPWEENGRLQDSVVGRKSVTGDGPTTLLEHRTTTVGTTADERRPVITDTDVTLQTLVAVEGCRRRGLRVGPPTKIRDETTETYTHRESVSVTGLL